MAFKLIAAVALLSAVASAVPVQHQHYADTPAHYDFAYSVHDEHTGDIKSQQESRNGDAVHGRYELIDSDGFKRIVEYTADEHTGFNAIVHREPTHIRVPLPAAQPQHAHFVHQAAHNSARQYSHVAPTQSHYVAAPVTAAPVQHHQQQYAYAAQHSAQHSAPIVVAHQQPQLHALTAVTTSAPFVHQPHQYVHTTPVPHYVQHQQQSSHQFNHEPSHVSFNAPGFNYNF